MSKIPEIQKKFIRAKLRGEGVVWLGARQMSQERMYQLLMYILERRFNKTSEKRDMDRMMRSDWNKGGYIT